MKTNFVKEVLKSGGHVIGSEVSRLPSSEVPNIYAAAGLDFVFIDMEHTPFNLETVAALIRAARQEQIVPDARAPQAEYVRPVACLMQGRRASSCRELNTPQTVAGTGQLMRHRRTALGFRLHGCSNRWTGSRVG
ncbi:MAG: hypothetical protein R3C02_12590 [Planctomycetaceae bacterium]